MKKVEVQKKQKVDEPITDFQVKRAICETENAFRTLQLYLPLIKNEEFVSLVKRNWQKLSADAAALVT